MRAYKLDVLIVDHDEIGPDAIQQELENTKYANWCMFPQVMSIKSADIGVWDDNHPLNKRDTVKATYQKLFKDSHLGGVCD